MAHTTEGRRGQPSAEDPPAIPNIAMWTSHVAETRVGLAISDYCGRRPAEPFETWMLRGCATPP